jgi:DNA mismatch repair ATPase MutS
VTRIVTPGTLTDPSLLEDKADYILLALSRNRSTVGLAWLSLASGTLLEYAGRTQGQALAHVTAVSAERAAEYVRLDAATRRNLELTETLRGEPAPTLSSLLDGCATGMGSRLLRHWLHHPRRDRAALVRRHGAVACLDKGFAQALAMLRRASDVERTCARLALKSVRPREPARLRDTLRLLPAVLAGLPDVSELPQSLRADLALPEPCLEPLAKALRERIENSFAPTPRNAGCVGASRFAERRCWAQPFEFAPGKRECKRRYGK